MSAEITVIKEQNGALARNELKNESLLSIIHDKNKIIEKFQRQLHFQKLQLKYYLGKTFRNKKMVEFANTCNPSVIEENIPITFAVNRFCLQVGIKSRIVVLYERMCRIDGRINNLLRIQEHLLRKMMENMYENVKKQKGLKMQIHIRSVVSEPSCMPLFTNLLNASIGLRKNLDTFRICCDRLMIIEEERNSIAEHVYSLPIEERTNCHYLIGIQIEKVQLQNRLKEIIKDQSVLRKRIEQLNEIEGELKNLQEEYKIANRNCTEHMTDMLRRVNFEALDLIAKSNQQREKYTKEIVKLKCENQRILKMVEQLKTSVRDKAFSKDSMKLDTIFSAGLYQALDRELNQAIQDNEMNKDLRIEKIRNECRDLCQKLQNARNENSLLEKELENVKIEYGEARRQWETDLEAVQQERNEYKVQVEDLQAIRAAYAQLVDSRANMTEEGQNLGTGLNNKELERENMKLTKEVALLKEETNKQKAKIRRLSEQILNFSGNNQKVLEIVQLETKDVGSGDVGNEFDSSLPKTNSCSTCAEKSELERGIIMQELQKSNVSKEDIQTLAESQKLDEITSNIVQDLTKSSNECQCSIYSSSPLDTSSDNRESSLSSKIISTPETSRINIGGINFEVPNRDIETTFEIHASRQDNGSPTKDSLDRNGYVDSFQIRDNSLVSVKLRCIPPKNYPKINIQGGSKNLDEPDNSSATNMNKKATPIKQMVQFKSLNDSNSTTQKDEVKALKVTYRNPHNYKSSTDSDPATESQSSGIENDGNMHVEEVKMRLRTMADAGDKNKEYPIVKYDSKIGTRSLGSLR